MKWESSGTFGIAIGKKTNQDVAVKVFLVSYARYFLWKI
jgi:hypothetical protein